MMKVNISGRSPTMAELASAENPQPNRALASAFDASKIFYGPGLCCCVRPLAGVEFIGQLE